MSYPVGPYHQAPIGSSGGVYRRETFTPVSGVSTQLSGQLDGGGSQFVTIKNTSMFPLTFAELEHAVVLPMHRATLPTFGTTLTWQLTGTNVIAAPAFIEERTCTAEFDNPNAPPDGPFAGGPSRIAQIELSGALTAGDPRGKAFAHGGGSEAIVACQLAFFATPPEGAVMNLFTSRILGATGYIVSPAALFKPGVYSLALPGVVGLGFAPAAATLTPFDVAVSTALVRV